MIGHKNSKKFHSVGQKLGMALNTMGQKLIPIAQVNVPHIVSSGLNVIEAHKSNSSAMNYLPMGLKHKEKSTKSNLEKH